MQEQLEAVERRYTEIQERLASAEVYADPVLLKKLRREEKRLSAVAEAYRRCRSLETQLQQTQDLMADPEWKAMAQEEAGVLKKQLEQTRQELTLLLLPRDPDDDKNVVLEIRSGVGGEEGALFAADLFRMYSMYAARRGWKLELLTLNETELGGVKEAVALVEGEGVYSRLKFESGVHRVQRIPETESSGRIQTSAATVAVLPEAEETTVQLDPADIEMQVYRSSGAGGQHVNKTSSAVRLIHKPSGMVVECQQERSQFENRAKAMRLLALRLQQQEEEKQSAALAAQRRGQVGSGDRSQRIRTYNFPQNRVTEHRLTGENKNFNLSAVIDGDLDPVIDALLTAEQAEKLRQAQTEE